MTLRAPDLRRRLSLTPEEAAEATGLSRETIVPVDVNDGTRGVRTALTPDHDTELIFDQPVIAFGMDYSTIAGAVSVQIAGGIYALSSRGWFGVISRDAPFREVRITVAGSDPAIFQFDDIGFAVPEPSAAALWLLGAAALAFRYSMLSKASVQPLSQG